MPTFGFSAYLKLICLNSKPQIREVRKRLEPDGSGYDFHKSLRALCRKYILNKEDILELTQSAQKIVQAPERNSALYGLRNLANWRAENPGTVVEFEPATFQSPADIFSVRFVPDFGIEIGTRRTAVHIWNTKRPELERRFVYGALALFPAVYAGMAHRPDDVAVLSLRNENLYCLSDVGDATAFGLAVATAIEKLFQKVAQEPHSPAHPSGPSPFAPPAPAP